MLAILISLIWHLFWLSAVRVVTKPSKREQVKFSKVSFLGPILQRGAIDLRVRPRPKSFLEERYAGFTSGLADSPARKEENRYNEYEQVTDSGAPIDKKMTDLIDEALGSSKSQPPIDPII